MKLQNSTPEGCFAVNCLGKQLLFERQTAASQLSHPRRARAQLPLLAAKGLCGESAYALAYNCVLLWQTLRGVDRLASPRAALRRFSLGEIARLSECYFSHGDLPFDLPETEYTDFDECAVNENFPLPDTADWEAMPCRT